MSTREMLEKAAEAVVGHFALHPDDVPLVAEGIQVALRELLEIHREDGTSPMLFKVIAITELEL